MSAHWKLNPQSELPPKKAKKYRDQQSFALAKSIRDFPILCESVGTRNEEALLCHGCHKKYQLPACASCGKDPTGYGGGYRGVHLQSGGAALFCRNCDAPFAAWDCPSCNSTNEVNLSLVRKASGCLILLVFIPFGLVAIYSIQGIWSAWL